MHATHKANPLKGSLSVCSYASSLLEGWLRDDRFLLKGTDRDGKATGYSGREEDPDGLSILTGEIGRAETARREKVSEQSMRRSQGKFLEGCKAAYVAWRTGPSSREE